jgi:hypothetical protein
MQRWYVSRNGQKDGPYSDSELKAMAANGTLTAAGLIWREGMPSWVEAGRIRGLFPQAPSPGKTTASPPPLPPVSQSAGRAASPAPSARAQTADSGRFSGRSYTVRRKVFKLFGGAFHLLDESNAVIGYSRQKAFKLKEDIRVFTDEQMTVELLSIRSRNVIDFSATYDVCDPTSGGRPLGSLRRKGWKSLVRDEWLVFDADGREIGLISEENGGLAILRRFIGWVNLISPQQYSFSADGRTVAQFKTNRNPFVYRLQVSFTNESVPSIPPQLVLAGSILLAAIEGKQA